MAKTFSAHITNGKLSPDSRHEMQSFVESLQEGQRYAIKIDDWEESKTNEQLKAFNLWCKMLQDHSETGYTAYEWKEMLKQMFGVKEIVDLPIIGKREIVKSQATYKKGEMIAFIEACEHFINAEQGIGIPFPNKNRE